MRAHPWSSWPDYLQAPGKRPRWLRVDRLLGEHHIRRDNAAGRRQLESDLEQLRGQGEEERYQAIRRGWCFGGETFRQVLLGRAQGLAGESHHAGLRNESDEDKARRILREELDKLDWSEADLSQHAKGDPRKVQIAQRLRAETSMTLKWIAQEVQMGVWTHVSNRLYHATRKTLNKAR